MTGRAEVLLQGNQASGRELLEKASDNPDIGPTPSVYVEYNFSTKKTPSKAALGEQQKVRFVLEDR